MGYSEIFAPPQKNYVGATKNNTGGHLKIWGSGKNSNMRGHTKFLGGFEKIEGARLSGGLLQRGVSNVLNSHLRQKTLQACNRLGKHMESM